jgi:hypothetical protein
MHGHWQSRGTEGPPPQLGRPPWLVSVVCVASGSSLLVVLSRRFVRLPFFEGQVPSLRWNW